jgi:uroporphyrinogen decarboxylase
MASISDGASEDGLSSRERFLIALRGGQPDCVPQFNFIYSQPLYEKLLGYRPEAYNARDAVKASLLLGMDAVYVRPKSLISVSATPRAESGHHTYTDEWGTTYRVTGASWPGGAPIDHPIRSAEDLLSYTFPDPTRPDRLADIIEALELSQDRLAVVAGFDGPVTTALLLTAWDTFFRALYDAPGFADDLLKLGTEYYSELCRRMIDAGVDAVCLLEDLGFSTGLYMSPTHFFRHVYPLLGDLIQGVKGCGIPVLLHCDGNINSVLADLVDLGIDGYNPVERKSQMDIYALKKAYGNRLCLVGNVDASATLCHGTVQAVRAEVLELLEWVAPGGAFVLSSDSDLRNEMPVENILAMVETGRKCGAYPISLPDVYWAGVEGI